MPLLGRVGLSLKGVNIYSPYEAGFGTSESAPPPFPCQDLDQDKDQDGYCEGGLDVRTCEDGLHHACGAEATITSFFLDACGGHATPYHLHHHPVCDYDLSAPGHSPMIGLALDGHGMYGYYEDTDKKPVLDACNGHIGPLPANSELGVAASTVYHYHFTSEQPFTIGCYGPVISIDECKKMYSTCNDGFVNVPASKEGGNLIYDLFCPCYTHNGSPYEGFEAAMTVLGMTATHHAVQGVNDGTAASRQKPSSDGAITNMHRMGARGTGSSSSTQCPASSASAPGPATGMEQQDSAAPTLLLSQDSPEASSDFNAEGDTIADSGWSITACKAWALGISIEVALAI